MRREITASASLKTVSLQISGLPTDARADGIGVRLLSHQPYAEPVVASSSGVLEQHRRAVVHGNQYVERSIVIEVTDGHAARGKAFGKCRTGSRADVLQSLPGVVKQQQGFKIFYVRVMGLDLVIRMAVGDEQIEVAVIVVVEELDAPAAHKARSAPNAKRA